MQDSVDISSKFSDDALDSLKSAADIAYAYYTEEVLPIHLLAFFAQQENFRQELNNIGITEDILKEKVKLTLKSKSTKIRPGIIIFSDELTYLLHLANIESIRYSRLKVTLGDLFLGLISLFSIKDLLKINEDQIEQVADWVIRNFSGQKIEPEMLTKDEEESTPLLNKYLLNLNNYLTHDILEEIMPRRAIEEQLITILTRQNKKNAILVGENGVGRKTAVFSIIKGIKSKTIPGNLQQATIISVNVNSLTSAVASFGRGDELIEVILAELSKRYKEKVILFIESIDSLFDNVKNPEGVKLINSLKEPIARGDIQLIATSSIAGFRKSLQSDEFFTSNFESIYVDEPDVEFASSAVKMKEKKIMKHFGVVLSDGVVEQIVTLSRRYIQNKFLPEKAIDLLDEIAANTANAGRKEVSIDQVKKIISLKTGIPLEALNQTEKDKLAHLEEKLAAIVKGQPYAVQSIAEVVKRSRAGLKDPKRPIGSFLFLGPSGVGKTYLSKTLAKLVYDSEDAMIRIDMSEFSESHTAQRLIGAPPGYVGYEEGGQLTNPIWDRPYSLILLDEIEKAHPKVFDIFLQVIDDGRLTDGQGKTVDFKNTIIIATSNIGSEDILEFFQSAPGLPTKEDEEQFLQHVLVPLLKEHFRPEFINRFDDIIIFNPLTKDQLFEIAKLEVAGIQERLKDKNIKINIPDGKLVEIVNKSYNPGFGARPLKRMLQEKIENVVASKIVSGEVRDGDVLNL